MESEFEQHSYSRGSGDHPADSKTPAELMVAVREEVRVREREREDTACFTVCVSSAECGTGVVTQVTATVPSKVAHRTTA